MDDRKQVVNATLKSCAAVLVLAAAVLTATAVGRSAEYDEQYTLFLTAGVARPAWPEGPFPAGDVQAVQARHGSLVAIARDLRAMDVHPPLYFWAVALWRRVAGPGLLAARMFSVLCGLAALTAVGVIATRMETPPALAMLLTLGCYGFAYTAAIARGFALAQALTLWGATVLLTASRRRRWAVGALLGAATFANYLALFPVMALQYTSPAMRERACPGPDPGPASEARRVRGEPHQTSVPHAPHPALRAGLSRAAGEALPCVAFLLADLWFFLAQRNSRPGQFPHFRLGATLWRHSLSPYRLARYAAANLFGGLPLYLPSYAQPVAVACVTGLALACAVLVALRWRHMPAAARPLLLPAVAPLIGLLLLGAMFRTTPVELRYLAFATPFAALLFAAGLATLPRALRHAAAALLVTVQAAALAGLVTRPETMQPARAIAAVAARFADGGIILVPRGNDGVGIVGSVATESAATQRLLIVDPNETRGGILARLGETRRVVLAFVAQDDTSRATLPAMRAAVAGSCWRPAGEGFNVAAFERICGDDAPR